MKNKKKQTPRGVASCRRPTFRSYTREEDYSPLRLTGPAGRMTVLLYDPTDETRSDWLVSDPKIEMKADVHRAFLKFSAIERRFLFNVLVIGKSLEQATARSKWTKERWRLWLNNTALPKLRRLLKDYNENGRVVI